MCHAGHRIEDVLHISDFFCDCGSRGKSQNTTSMYSNSNSSTRNSCCQLVDKVQLTPSPLSDNVFRPLKRNTGAIDLVATYPLNRVEDRVQITTNTNSFNNAIIHFTNLFNKWANNKQIVISPASILTPMLLAYTGHTIAHPISTEFERVFCSPNIRDSEFKHIHPILNTGVVKSSNHLIVNADKRVNTNWIQHINTLGCCNVTYRPFTEPTEISNYVNTLVAQETNNKITNIVEPTLFTPDSLLILLNTIYFKGSWKYPFIPHLTRNSTRFVTLNNSYQGVSMMKQDDPINVLYYEDDKTQIVELPYKEHNNVYSMGIVLSRFNNYDEAVEFKHTHHLSPTQVLVEIPKFKHRNKLELVNTFKDMGMQHAFDETANSFNRIGENVFISDIIHEAVIEIDENGTEAAAATVLIAKQACCFILPVEPKKFIANHTFRYYIRHTPSNTFLFWGTFDGESSK